MSQAAAKEGAGVPQRGGRRSEGDATGSGLAPELGLEGRDNEQRKSEIMEMGARTQEHDDLMLPGCVRTDGSSTHFHFHFPFPQPDLLS